MRLIDADESHLPSIREITNDVIANTTAIYDDEPATEAETRAWFAKKRSAGLPVLVAVSSDGVVAGFASYGVFNARPGYRRSVEHSVHVAAVFRGQGLGGRLLEALEARAREAGVHTLVGLIDAENVGSIRLHKSCGFTHAGTLRQVGWKFGRWLDMSYYQKLLDP